jgi:hypothetical protein
MLASMFTTTYWLLVFGPPFAIALGFYYGVHLLRWLRG